MDNVELEQKVKEILNITNFFDMLLAAKEFEKDYKTSDFYNGKESWIFERSPELDEALEFFFYMRKRVREKADK